MEAGGLFQYFATLTEKADPLFQRWLLPWSTLKGLLRVGERKNKFGSTSNELIYFGKQI